MSNKYVIFGLAVTIAAAFIAPQFLGPHDTHQILAHLEVEDMPALPSYDFDGFVYGHTGAYEDVVDSLTASGKLCLRYFNVLTYPLTDWVDSGNEWFDYFWYNYGQAGRNFYDFNTKKFGVFPYFGKPYLVNWAKIDSVRAQRIVNKQYELARGAGVFLDQTWARPQPWMFDPAYAEYSAFPDSVYGKWQSNFAAYLRMVQRKFGPSHVLLNGDETLGAPVYLEHSEWAWEPSKVIWAQDKRNVLSVQADYPLWVDMAVNEWKAKGGWIAFTGNDPAKVTAAYVQANSARN